MLPVWRLSPRRAEEMSIGASFVGNTAQKKVDSNNQAFIIRYLEYWGPTPTIYIEYLDPLIFAGAL